jgi:hypothetical protein
MPGPTGASQIPSDPILTRISGLEQRVKALEDAKDAPRPVAALGLSAVQPVPMPESEIPAATERVLAEMRAQGWDQPEARTDCVASIADALRYGIPEDTLKAHYGALIAKLNSVEDQNIGHGALRLIDESLYALLLDGRGIGYSIQLITPESFKEAFGYTLDELIAMEPEGKYITDPALFIRSGGTQGMRDRVKDAFGNWL